MTRVSDDLLCVVSRARVILYDFDGPLCDVFAGLPAALAAQQAGQLIGADFETDDPLEVLRLAVARGIDAATAEDAVIAVEKAAIDCARATSGGIESVRLALSKDVAWES